APRPLSGVVTCSVSVTQNMDGNGGWHHEGGKSEGQKGGPPGSTACLWATSPAFNFRRATSPPRGLQKKPPLSFKVQVGPPQIAIHQGRTVLVTEPNGQITGSNEKGLYFFDTRVISNWAIYANGEPWELLNGGAVRYYEARIFLTNKTILTEDG